MSVKAAFFALTFTSLLAAPTGGASAQSHDGPSDTARVTASADRDSSERQSRGKAIAGTWQVSADPNNPPPGFPEEFLALHTFTEDGRFIETSSTNPLGKSPAHGEWKHDGGRQFSSTFLFFAFDPVGHHAVTIRVRSRVTLNRQGDAWSGRFEFDVLTPDGHLIQTGNGTHSATRVSVLPL